MKIDCTNFKKFIHEYFIKLPNEINFQAGKEKLLREDFDVVTSSNEAKKAKNVIYIWRTKTPIPRLKGKCDIIYIGQTKRSIFSRHGNSRVKASSEANSQKYNDIVNLYGALTISYINVDDFDPENKTNLLKAEGQFLWWYFQNHSEYPPINYTKTKVRNPFVEINT
jgi:hypothetical protein